MSIIVNTGEITKNIEKGVVEGGTKDRMTRVVKDKSEEMDVKRWI